MSYFCIQLFLQASAITLTEAMPADKSGLDPATKLAKLRELMAAADGGVDALIVPSEDPHMVCSALE